MNLKNTSTSPILGQFSTVCYNTRQDRETHQRTFSTSSAAADFILGEGHINALLIDCQQRERNSLHSSSTCTDAGILLSNFFIFNYGQGRNRIMNCKITCIFDPTSYILSCVLVVCLKCPYPVLV